MKIPKFKVGDIIVDLYGNLDEVAEVNEPENDPPEADHQYFVSVCIKSTDSKNPLEAIEVGNKTEWTTDILHDYKPELSQDYMRKKELDKEAEEWLSLK